MPSPLDASSLNRFRGAFTAIVTPFSADGSRLDFARLEEQIAFQKQGGVTGIVIAGTTGESPTLEEGEYRELVDRGVALAHGHGLLAIVGTGSNSTAHATHLQKTAAKAGADAALCVNPYYNKPTQDGLIRHFLAMADAAPLPIMLYNIPGRTGVALTSETIVRLAQHPHIRFIKDATGALDAANETLLHAPTLSVFSGDDPLTYPMMALGAKGVVSVLSNIVPERVQGLCRAMLEGKHTEGLRIHRELWSLTKALFAETNPIPVKAAMWILGRDSGALRLPMSPASGATVDRLRAEMRRLELLPA
ncbi:MAG TPA: 4-hydroxy-tetrahydrodipicolinate synthase [Phycisphaerales bacterium]|nr:4-hydroxy-tetrahydrodipicolinate synthase [Phycisphaerales bacterium]